MASLLFSVTSDHQDASVYWEAISCAEQASLINSSAGFKAQTEPAEITEWNNICYDVIKHVNGLLGGTGACPADRQGVCVCVRFIRLVISCPFKNALRNLILTKQEGVKDKACVSCGEKIIMSTVDFIFSWAQAGSPSVLLWLPPVTSVMCHLQHVNWVSKKWWREMAALQVKTCWWLYTINKLHHVSFSILRLIQSKAGNLVFLTRWLALSKWCNVGGLCAQFLFAFLLDKYVCFHAW